MDDRGDHDSPFYTTHAVMVFRKNHPHNTMILDGAASIRTPDITMHKLTH